VSSVDFDDELFFATDEIDDVGAGGLLPDELAAAKPPIAQREPQFHFNVGALTTKRPLHTNFALFGSAHAHAGPSPTSPLRGSAPSPRKGAERVQALP
jgi:hypothetical protein